MPRTAIKILKCAGCDTFLNKVAGKKKIVNNANEAHDFSSSLQRIIVVDDILCKKCRLSIYKKKNPEKDAESETLPLNPIMMIRHSKFNPDQKKQLLRSNVSKFPSNEPLVRINIVVFVFCQII